MNLEKASTIPEMHTADLKLKGFNVYKASSPVNKLHTIGRRHFYKIVLVKGHLTIGYGNRSTEINDTFLFFANPKIPHSVIHHSEKNISYACVFTDSFIMNRVRTGLLRNSALFRTDISPVVPLSSEQAVLIIRLYEKMISARNNDYHHRGELIKSCIELLMHEGLSIQPSQTGSTHKDGATRITHMFLELLERQFPIESITDPLDLRSAQDFAEGLAIHVNYLNRSVKKVTGKPTTAHIAERITAEAKALLQHTDWSVADIAYGLGFKYPTYFNNYFKRTTGFAPKSFRRSGV